MRKLNYSHSIGCALKKPLIRGLLLVYLLTPTYCFSQASVETIVDRLEQYKGSYPQEKVFVHLDRPYYTVGDNIWYKVYLVDAITHVQATPSTIVTVELLNPSDSLVSRQHIKIDKGRDHGDIKVPLDWMPGPYLLRAYTNYQLNYSQEYIFSQKVEIYGPTNKALSGTKVTSDQLRIVFFPEGGDLIQGIANNVAFEVTRKGVPIDAVGTLVNQQGDSLQTIKTLYSGLGYFRIKPRTAETCYVVINHQGEKYKTPLPAILEDGFVMNVINRDADHFTVDLSASAHRSLVGGFLIAHLRGEPILAMDDLDGQHYLAKISKKELGPGLLHLTYFDSNAIPRCERLIFIATDLNLPKVGMSMAYDKRLGCCAKLRQYSRKGGWLSYALKGGGLAFNLEVVSY